MEHGGRHAFECDRTALVAERDEIGRSTQVGKTKDNERSERRTMDEAHVRFDDRDACAFGADEGARDVETIFGQS